MQRSNGNRFDHMAVVMCVRHFVPTDLAPDQPKKFVGHRQGYPAEHVGRLWYVPCCLSYMYKGRTLPGRFILLGFRSVRPHSRSVRFSCAWQEGILRGTQIRSQDALRIFVITQADDPGFSRLTRHWQSTLVSLES